MHASQPPQPGRGPAEAPPAEPAPPARAPLAEGIVAALAGAARSGPRLEPRGGLTLPATLSDRTAFDVYVIDVRPSQLMSHVSMCAVCSMLCVS